MAKQGQHQNDSQDKTKSKGPNNPSKSVTITTGSYKKPETYRKQAAQHKDTDPLPQADKNEWNEDTRDKPTIEGSPRARTGDLSRSGRAHGSGSDSNASSKTRGY
jgi:hypothetical protein